MASSIGTDLLESEPSRAIDELRGRIWRRVIGRMSSMCSSRACDHLDQGPADARSCTVCRPSPGERVRARRAGLKECTSASWAVISDRMRRKRRWFVRFGEVPALNSDTASVAYHMDLLRHSVLLSTWIFLATSAQGGQVHDNSRNGWLKHLRLRNVWNARDSGLFADAALRDIEVGWIPPLLHDCRSREEYLLALFAALVVNVLIAVAIPLGSFCNWTDTRVHRSSGRSVMAYVQPFLLLLIPNTILPDRCGLPSRCGVAGHGCYLGAVALSSAISSQPTTAISSRIDARRVVRSIRDVGIVGLNRSWTTIGATQLIGFPAHHAQEPACMVRDCCGFPWNVVSHVSIRATLKVPVAAERLVERRDYTASTARAVSVPRVQEHLAGKHGYRRCCRCTPFVRRDGWQLDVQGRRRHCDSLMLLLRWNVARRSSKQHQDGHAPRCYSGDEGTHYAIIFLISRSSGAGWCGRT